MHLAKGGHAHSEWSPRRQRTPTAMQVIEELGPFLWTPRFGEAPAADATGDARRRCAVVETTARNGSLAIQVCACVSAGKQAWSWILRASPERGFSRRI